MNAIKYDFKQMKSKAQTLRQILDKEIEELIRKRELVTRIERGIEEEEKKRNS